jgi:UDPglucose 6-dehydrogenase
MDKPLLIVNKSTAPVGTVAKLKKKIAYLLSERGENIPFDVVSNPEFLKEGAALADCRKPDRIIIGANSEKSVETLKHFYHPFSLNHDRILTMSPESAEMSKYASNVMLAARISLMNEIASVCEATNANIHEVRKGVGSDSRIGYDFLYAGVGYGGSCFPKDIEALKFMAKEYQCQSSILDAIQEVNLRQKQLLFKKLMIHFDNDLSNKRIAIWGLSFKPETDDIRNAPSIELIRLLNESGADIVAYDPVAMDNMKKILPGIEYAQDEYAAAINADAIALVTEWKQFRFVDHRRILDSMNGNAFFDGRNQYHLSEMKRLGYEYYGIGVVDQSLNPTMIGQTATLS